MNVVRVVRDVCKKKRWNSEAVEDDRKVLSNINIRPFVDNFHNNNNNNNDVANTQNWEVIMNVWISMFMFN